MKLRKLSDLFYKLHETLVRRPTFSYYSDLLQSQWLSRDEIERLQMEKLKALLKIASDQCPWHAERINQSGININGDTALSLDDLQRLPTMDKEDARLNRDRIA